jgi:hypothetical protein
MSQPSAARWRQEGFEPFADDAALGPILAADSWLLLEGAAIGIAAHRDRFLTAMPDDLGSDPDLGPAAFWDAAIASLPRGGAWFPRLELRRADGAVPADVSRHELLLRLRPAPALRRDIALVTADVDPRRAPGVKGPDIDRLDALRAAVRASGADDAVLLDADGSVAETTTANLAWWRGGILCVPDAGIPRVAGVTVGALVAIATALGLDVVEERAAPDDLDGCEIWALNALHGIRIVTAWPGGPDPAAEPGRLTSWRSRIAALRRPLPEAVTA